MIGLEGDREVCWWEIAAPTINKKKRARTGKSDKGFKSIHREVWWLEL